MGCTTCERFAFPPSALASKSLLAEFLHVQLPGEKCEELALARRVSHESLLESPHLNCDPALSEIKKHARLLLGRQMPKPRRNRLVKLLAAGGASAARANRFADSPC